MIPTGKANSRRPDGGAARPGSRLVRRYTHLMTGLVAYGISMALMIESTLGLNPWDVFHQGVAEATGVRFGWVVIGVGAVVLLAWIPLRQRPGVGTVANVVVVGLAVDAALAVLPTVQPMGARIAFLVAGVVLNGAATGLYIGARLGPGPRDGLMTGYVALRPGRSIRLVRTVIEVAVLAVGWLLGGTLGLGTVLYAVAIGPLSHAFIPLFTVPVDRDATAPTDTDGQPTDRDATQPTDNDALPAAHEPTLPAGAATAGVDGPTGAGNDATD